MNPIAVKLVSGLVWIVCGVLVIIIRGFIIQTASILVWELVGGGMVVYGSARLLWNLARRAPAKSSIP